MQLEIARQKERDGPRSTRRASRRSKPSSRKRKAEFERQKQEIARLEADVTSYKATVAKLETSPQPAKPVVAIAPPSIQIIDPPIVVTRDTATVKVRTGLSARTVVGHVTAPAGLAVVHRQRCPSGRRRGRVFQDRRRADGRGKTRVTMVAVDRQGKRAQLEFFLQEDATIGKALSWCRRECPARSLGLGKYYALVIGNQKYQKLASLDTPEADASDIAALLKDRYGFTVTILLNATRWEMLEELNKMRVLLTEKDNLLIYYAGHGQLDRVNCWRTGCRSMQIPPAPRTGLRAPPSPKI